MMGCDLTSWIPVVSTAIGGLIGFGSAWIAGSLQARRERETRSEERLDRDNRELRGAYHRWFALASELSLRAQIVPTLADTRSPEATAKLAEAMLANFKESATVFHGVLLLETDKEARRRLGELLSEMSVVVTSQALGELSDQSIAMQTWEKVHKKTAVFQDWLIDSRFGGAK